MINIEATLKQQWEESELRERDGRVTGKGKAHAVDDDSMSEVSNQDANQAKSVSEEDNDEILGLLEALQVSEPDEAYQLQEALVQIKQQK